MDSQQLLEKITPFIKKNLLVLALGLVGMMFFAYGLIALFGEANSAEEIVFEQGSEETLGASNAKIIEIKVDVQGAVLKPGVHNLASNARLQDAFIAAGGLSDLADREWVSKNLNLAQKLTDGAKFYVPKIGENSKNDIYTASGSKSVLNAQINVNSASISELDSLPGIGQVTAQKIIDNRPYGLVEDLISKKVVSQKVFEQIKEKIMVY